MDPSGRTDNILGRFLRFRAPERPRGQRGVALFEVLVAIAILSILFVTLALGMVTSVRASSTVKDHQRAETTLTAYAEALKQLEYLPCGTPAEYDTAFAAYDAAAPEFGVSVEITGIDFGDEDACSGSNPDSGTQTLNLSTQYKDIVATGQITKRNPDAVPSAPDALDLRALTADGQCPCQVVNGGERKVGLELNADLKPGDGYANGTEITSYEWTVVHQGTTIPATGKSHLVLVDADETDVTQAQVTLKVTDSLGDTEQATCSVDIPALGPDYPQQLPTTTTTTPP